MFGKDNEGLNRYLNEIYTAGIRGRELIQQMMLFSRKDQSQHDIIPMDIGTSLEEITKMLKGTFPAGINVDTSIKQDIPRVKGNPSLISQVLMNLCINAKDSMGIEGNLFISLTVEDINAELCSSCREHISGKYVAIHIEDNGAGISENILTHIFEPFFTSKEIGSGTGMGLSVVHGIVHKLGGHIVVTSHVGEGTKFKVYLPISDERGEDIELANAEEDSMQYDFSGLRVMVVDDEPSIAALLEASLEQCHAKVQAFTNSQQALAYFETAHDNIDLVITDQTMPSLTGIALSEKLLALRPDIKIILCTGHSADVTEKLALESGIKAFTYKPVKMNKLYQTIKDIV